jgi:hypothetical protein
VKAILASFYFKYFFNDDSSIAEPSSDELKRIMYQHGGHYEHYLSKRRVTHIIATSLPNSKITKGLKHCKVVKPEWITERQVATTCVFLRRIGESRILKIFF